MKLSSVLAFAGALILGAGFAGEALAETVLGRTKMCCTACQFSKWIPGPPGSPGSGKYIRLNPPLCVGGERVLISAHCPWGKYTCT